MRIQYSEFKYNKVKYKINTGIIQNMVSKVLKEPDLCPW